MKALSNNVVRPLVSFQNVTLRACGRDCLRVLNWIVRPGECWAVLGENGSGKSVLLDAVRGLVPVSRGEIAYGLGPGDAMAGDYPERAIAHVSVAEHRALVSEVLDYHQARWSPVEERERVLVRDLLGGTRRERQAISRLFGIEALQARELGTLSNGEMRKALIARALLTRPQLLLLDDPFAGLDTEARRRLRTLLSRLVRGGMTLVIATTRPEELPAATSHLIGVAKRRVIFQGARRTCAVRARELAVDTAAAPAAPAAAMHWRRAGRGHPVDEPLVELRNIHVTYGRARILQGVSWTIQPGENWVVCGPNGSGKTTLMSLILADHTQAYVNDIRLFGMRRGSGESIWEIKRHIGWAAPELQYHYDGEATCFEVVCSGLYDTIGLYRECSVREERQTRRWMRNLGVTRFADAPFAEMHDGTQRLVLLARALVKEPPLVILDEPCQGLDGAHRRVVLEMLRRIAAHPGVAVVYITHHPEEIPPEFAHELRLARGRVVRCGMRRSGAPE